MSRKNDEPIVLIVDDDPILRSLAVARLKSSPFRDRRGGRRP